ncbi:MAG: tRNA (adenosine(37)-N6)-dimethylallyltransferase MiaA [Patescibacteria group bacterium]
MTPELIVIVGPTASGKSDLAVRLAKKHNGEIISADSRQVYKGLNIGSGKITKKEMKGVPHYLLDVANPKKQFTVANYVELAHKALEKILEKNKTPIVVGGTGFYIQAFVDGIVLPEVPPNNKLRAQLEKKSATQLFGMIRKLDPSRAKDLDPLNARRLIRAIEIAKTLGKVPKLTSRPLPYKTIFIGTKISPTKLKEKIRVRLMKRLRNGMIDEARRLHTQGLSWKRMEELGLEYRYLAYFLQNKMTKKEMVEKLATEIWHYSRRQMTWFKRDKRIVWRRVVGRNSK